MLQSYRNLRDFNAVSIGYISVVFSTLARKGCVDTYIELMSARKAPRLRLSVYQVIVWIGRSR